jgi:alginate O-acetyltransferase complex protein AlgJ
MSIESIDRIFAAEAADEPQAAPAPRPPRAKRHLEREEEAELILRHTAVKPWLAWSWVGLFALTVLAIPASQCIPPLRHGLEAGAQASNSASASLPWLPRPVVDADQSTADPPSAPGTRPRYVSIPKAEDIRKFEHDFQEQSLVFTALRPEVQATLTRALHASNAKVYPGKDNWLFYRQEIDYLTGPPFLDPAVLKQRANTGIIQPDPTGTILRLRSQLAKRGIQLLVMPIPAKATIYPEKLTNYRVEQPPQNPSYARFIQNLQAADVPVFDPTTVLLQAKRDNGQLLYVPTDTHWTPAAIVAVAQALGDVIKKSFALPARPPIIYTKETHECMAPDDLVRQLGLPKNQSLYQRVKLPYIQINAPDGKPCTPMRDADILVLGDSYCGMYEPAGAGLVQQLSYVLQRPVDGISVPNGGSFGARELLRKELLKGEDRLATKKLLIYEFNVRDFIMGDWRTIDLPIPAATPQPSPTPVVATKLADARQIANSFR